LDKLKSTDSPHLVDDQVTRDGELLREARVKTDDDGLIEFLDKQCVSDTDVQSMARLISELGSSNFQKRDHAAGKLVAIGASAVAPLQKATTDSDLEISRRAKRCLQELGRRLRPELSLAVVRLLARREPANAIQTLIRYLPFAPDEDVTEEIVYALDRLAFEDDRLHPALLRTLNDTFAPRRAAAACIVARRGNVDQRNRARVLLDDTEPVVRLRTAQGLLGAKDKTAVPALVALLNEPAVSISWQAEELLHWAAGDAAPDVAVGAATEPERQRCHKAWATWWRERGQTLNLAQLDFDHRRPGLIIVYDQASDRNQNLIWLCGCDGKPRWQLSAWPPVGHIQLVSGNHILMTEYQTPDHEEVPRRPTVSAMERDLAGTLIRKYTGFTNALECRLLFNGGVFITFHGLRVGELSSDWKELYSRDFTRNHELMSYADLRHLRNGRLFCTLSIGHGLESIAEVDPVTGSVLKRIRLQTNVISSFHVEPLTNGHYLITATNSNRLLEYDGAGRIVWERAAATPTFATRLRNGNLLVSCGLEGRLIEVDPAGKLHWEAFTHAQPSHFSSCFNLARFGFDRPAAAQVDLATSVQYRLKCLHSKDPFLRRGAARLVWQLGPHAVTAIPALIEELDQPDEFVRGSLSDAFAKLGANAIIGLVRATKDSRPRVRGHAVAALANFIDHPDDTTPVILAAIEDADTSVRRMAIGALRANLFLRREAGSAPRMITEKEVAKIVPVLVQALRNTERGSDVGGITVAQGAALILQDLGPKAKSSIPQLIEALHSEDLTVRGFSLDILGALGPEAVTAVPDLVKILSNPEKDTKAAVYMRNGCTWVLAQIGPGAKDAIPVLVRFFKDSSLAAKTRGLAAEALGKIGKDARQAVPALTEGTHDSNEAVRQAAADALKRIAQ
jgi:HEAT repeat protein